MESNQLISYKDKYKILEKNIIAEIVSNFNNSTTKQKKITSKKKNNIFKNSKFRLDKDKIKNKIILILNKVSENNIDNLIIEFLCNINIENENDFEIIQRETYIKLLKDIKFIDNFLNFLVKIFKIVYYKFNFLPTYFYNLIDDKLKYDYSENYLLEDSNLFIEELSDEVNRESNLILIYNLNKYNFFTRNISEDVSSILLLQNRYIPDIYYWYKLLKLELNQYTKTILENKINENKISIREEILIQSLIDGIYINNENNIESNIDCNLNEEVTSNNKNNDKNKLFLIELENIIDEYIYLKDNEEIIEFLKTNCNSFDQKNLVCMNLIKCFFKNTDIEWFNLFNILISKKYIFKSNMSKGLILFIKDNNTNNKQKMKEFLIFLKQKNITKNIVYIFKKNNIKISY
jgi:hypothetical protein